MIRILTAFLAVSSLFIAPAARAQQMNGAPSSTTVERPAIMMHHWESSPVVPPDQKIPAPPRPAALDDQTFKKDPAPVAPAQPDYGTNTHLEKLKTAIDRPQMDGTVTAPQETAEDNKTEEQSPPPVVKGDFAELRQMDTATVDQVLGPLTVRLKDGRIVQLSALDIPDLDPYEPGEVAMAAMTALTEMLNGKQVRLYQTKNAAEGRSNRMGYLLAHLVLPGNDGWVQGALLASGLARIRPSERNTEMTSQMMAIEDKARQEKKGLWADDRYAVLTPETAANGIGGWAVAEGKVLSASLKNNTLYLNFGQDWKTDFTVALDSATRSAFVKTGQDPMNFGGKTVRVRGWLRDYNGPFMDLIAPVWLTVLPDAPAGDKVPE